jgi:hypothetical protein
VLFAGSACSPFLLHIFLADPSHLRVLTRYHLLFPPVYPPITHHFLSTILQLSMLCRSWLLQPSVTDYCCAGSVQPPPPPSSQLIKSYCCALLSYQQAHSISLAYYYRRILPTDFFVSTLTQHTLSSNA